MAKQSGPLPRDGCFTAWRMFSVIILISILAGLCVPKPVTAMRALRPSPGEQPSFVPGSVRRQPVASGNLLALQATATPTLTNEQLLQALQVQLDIAWNAQNWQQAILIIQAMIDIDPNYDNIQEKYYYAYVNYGYQLLTAGDCTGSKQAFLEALSLRPTGEEALMGLELVGQYCATPAPPTATITPTGPAATLTITHTPTNTPAPDVTSTVTLTEPIQYEVKAGDTLFSLAKRYNTTIQAIMQANGMMTTFLRAGEIIWIPASAPPPGPLVHIVQPGETLFSIARKYNTTVWAIMAANSLTSSTIYAYRALFIPSVMQPGPIIHIVMPGETLFTISQKYGTTVPLIMLANGLTDYYIYVYQQLIIPPEGWTGWPITPPGFSPHTPLLPGQLYVVQPGDTLYSIARRFGTTVGAIMTANGLSSTTIRAGSTLRIP